MSKVITFDKGSKKKLSKNFSAHEFECHCKVDHECKIDEALIEKLQIIRDRVGKPIKITSGYRCKAYNQRIGGASKSYHMQGMAADLQILGIDPRLVSIWIAEAKLRVGIYDTFSHSDVSGREHFIG